jgi:hypothetical protein
MQRRIATYPATEGWNFLNMLSSIGAFILAFSILPFLLNVYITLRSGKKVGPNPWDGMTLEWATESPPHEHNFEFIPPIRSERPVWDLNHPEQRSLPHGRHAKQLAHDRVLVGVGARTAGTETDVDAGGHANGGNGHGHSNGGNGHSNGGAGNGHSPGAADSGEVADP